MAAMGKAADLKPRRKLLPRRKWLEALFDPRSELDLVVCRYHRRRGAFGHGESVMSEHLVTFMEQGHLPAVVAGRDLRLGAGEALWLSPGQSRRYYGTPATPLMRHYNLRFALRRGGKQLLFLRRPVVVANAWELQPTIQQLYDLYQHGHRMGSERLRGLIVTLATSFMGLMAADEPRESGRTLSPAQRLRLNQYMVDHISEGISPEDLALEAGLSLDYFSRLFRNTYGVAPRYHLKRERVRLAAIQLLETEQSVAEIARGCGTDNVSLFCRQFRDEMGCTPSEYRRREVPPLT
jgi:AraC-like DNA-binding protein